MDKFAVLSKFDFFTKASVSFQEEICSTVRPANLKAGAYFYLEGDYCPQVALVGSGNIRVFKTSDKGRQITLYHLREGETCLVNMLCAFLNHPSPAAAQAETAVDALLIPAVIFREWIRTTDLMRNHVFERMSSRIMEVMTLVEEVAFRKMDRRIAAFLIQQFQSSDSTKVLTITHDEIATELGSVREVVSRVLKDFEHHGAIAIARNRIELCSLSVLREVTGR